MTPSTAAGSDRARFRSLVTTPEFRPLWLAHVLSCVGDELATFALALLIYQRTGSAFAVAVTMTFGFLPYALGGPILSGLADLLPRRPLMVSCDLIRAALVLGMIIPDLPIAALWLLLFLVIALESPFSAARAATMPDVLPGDHYVLGSAVMNVTTEVARLMGAIAAGLLLKHFDATTALLADAATFLASAALIRFGLRWRKAEGLAGGFWSGPVRGAWAGARLIARDRQLRVLALLGLLGAFYIVPRALAVPFVAGNGGGPGDIAWLLAADPAGTILGALIVGRFCSPRRRMALMGPLAVLSCAPLILSGLPLGISVIFVLWTLAGVGTAYNLPANSAFVAAVPVSQRGQAFGLVTAAMSLTQGVAILVAGAFTALLSPGAVIAVFGGLGTVAALLLAWSIHRSPPRTHWSDQLPPDAPISPSSLP